MSDDDAVTLLFDLAAHGEAARDKLVQLDALVYGRLVQAYDADELPVLRQLAAA
ncbi:MAG: hypothetical protein ACREPE_06950 [Lysobacter sp.]